MIKLAVNHWRATKERVLQVSKIRSWMNDNTEIQLSIPQCPGTHQIPQPTISKILSSRTKIAQIVKSFEFPYWSFFVSNLVLYDVSKDVEKLFEECYCKISIKILNNFNHI